MNMASKRKSPPTKLQELVDLVPLRDAGALFESTKVVVVWCCVKYFIKLSTFNQINQFFLVVKILIFYFLFKSENPMFHVKI